MAKKIILEKLKSGRPKGGKALFEGLPRTHVRGNPPYYIKAGKIVYRDYKRDKMIKAIKKLKSKEEKTRVGWRGDLSKKEKV
ncbi:MAG: hypothetical protein QXT31_07450 [Candidatus Bathyarchaeia archaeon]